MKRRHIIIGAGAAATLAACGEAIDENAFGGAPVEVTELDEKLSALRAAFDAAAGCVRLLFVVGPSCGPCLRGLIDMDKELGERLLSDARLKVFVVHVPTLSAELHHAQRAAKLLQGSSVRNFWDPSGRSGDVVQQTLQIPEYAWDVWLTYDPGDLWQGDAPPAPATWSHQLGALDKGTRLEPASFAADVRKRVGELN
ncbi:MAG: hypothetical protein Q8R02_19235 [Hyphomonadaceae bacterium]|nr:hypothetical protein [Hyphomonadaceae bacterium]